MTATLEMAKGGNSRRRGLRCGGVDPLDLMGTSPDRADTRDYGSWLGGKRSASRSLADYYCGRMVSTPDFVAWQSPNAL